MKWNFHWIIITSALVSSFANAGVSRVDGEFKLPALKTVEKNVSVSTGRPLEEKIFKNIHKGNHELNPTLGLGYSSFWGVMVSTSLAYRYFFFDKISFGVLGGFNSSEVTRSYHGGLTARWYFADWGKWALSATQNLVYQKEDNKIYGTRHWVGDVKGQTGLGAHYFITPNFNINFNLNYQYSVIHPEHNSDTPDIRSKVGFGINF